MDANDLKIWPSIEQIEAMEQGQMADIWKLLQCQDKLVLTPVIAERYKAMQKRYIHLTGHSLPDTIKGAIKTRAQARDDMGPEIKDEVLDKAVQGGLAARLKKMREGKK